MADFRDAASCKAEAELTIGEELVALLRRILETDREPDDQARQQAQCLILLYDIKRK